MFLSCIIRILFSAAYVKNGVVPIITAAPHRAGKSAVPAVPDPGGPHCPPKPLYIPLEPRVLLGIPRAIFEQKLRSKVTGLYFYGHAHISEGLSKTQKCIFL